MCSSYWPLQLLPLSPLPQPAFSLCFHVYVDMCLVRSRVCICEKVQCLYLSFFLFLFSLALLPWLKMQAVLNESGEWQHCLALDSRANISVCICLSPVAFIMLRYVTFSQVLWSLYWEGMLNVAFPVSIKMILWSLFVYVLYAYVYMYVCIWY